MPNFRACRSLVGNVSVGFDLDAPGRVEQRSHDHHGCCGSNDAEEFAVDMADGLPVFSVGQVHAGTVDVFDGATALFKGCGDDGEALVSLSGYVGLIATDRAGAGDVDLIADAHGSREPDDGLEGAGSGDVLASHRM